MLQSNSSQKSIFFSKAKAPARSFSVRGTLSLRQFFAAAVFIFSDFNAPVMRILFFAPLNTR